MPDIFRSIEWLSTYSQEVTIVDVRDEWAYDEQHIPGAINIPFDTFRNPTEEMPGKLPTADEFSRLLSDAGISPSDQLLAYDDEFGVYASRFLVTAELFGHDVDKLFLLDGGYTAWQRNRSTSKDTPAVTAQEYPCEFINESSLIDAPTLEAALDTETVIVDTRDPIEYDTVHISGAINLQWRALIDDDLQQLHSDAECRRLLEDHGIDFDRPVCLYCNTARRLSFVYAVLRELGHDDVAFYEDGIAAWADHGGPVETTS